MLLPTLLRVASDNDGKEIFVLSDYATSNKRHRIDPYIHTVQAEAVLNHSTQPWTQIVQEVSIIPPMIFYDESAAAVVGITIPHPAITKKKTIAHAIARNFVKPV
jgi:hypothetical protein